MHPTVRLLPLLAVVLLTAEAMPAFAASPTDACSVLTAAQVSSVVGVVGPAS
jgi:hypothetical protein